MADVGELARSRQLAQARAAAQQVVGTCLKGLCSAPDAISPCREAPRLTATKFKPLRKKYPAAFDSKASSLAEALRDPEVGINWVWAADPRSSVTDEIDFDTAVALTWHKFTELR